jgi:uncharacterized protein YndB with AHSA1/START domain
MENKIQKQVELRVPVARVWRALTDSGEFGQWFRVKLDKPFAVGRTARGHILHPGYEHVVFEAVIESMEPEKLFAFRWAHPRSHKKEEYSSDYRGMPTTLVEFQLKATANGTLLTVTESGFENIPEEWRMERLRGNEGGWEQQMKNIEAYVAKRT